MISLWSSFFSSYQCFIFRTWKHSLGFLFYNSSKQNTDSHTAAPSEKQRLLKAHSASVKLIHAFLKPQSRLFSVATRVIATTALDMNPWAWLRFGPEGFRRGRTWKGGVKKPTSICWLSVKQCRQHSSENKRGDTFLFLIESPHMTLHGPETRCTSRSFQHFCNWNDFISFLSATNLSFKSFVLCSPLRRWSETGRTLLFCCFRIV